MLYFVMLGYYLLEDCSSKEKKKVNLDGGKEVGGIEGWETITSVYSMRKESISNKRR